jgi:hypothetical protein
MYCIISLRVTPQHPRTADTGQPGSPSKALPRNRSRDGRGMVPSMSGGDSACPFACCLLRGEPKRSRTRAGGDRPKRKPAPLPSCSFGVPPSYQHLLALLLMAVSPKLIGESTRHSCIPPPVLKAEVVRDKDSREMGYSAQEPRRAIRLSQGARRDPRRRGAASRLRGDRIRPRREGASKLRG